MDKVLMRMKDSVLLIMAIGSLLTAFGKMFIMANSIEAQAKKVEALEPIVVAHQTKIAINDERWEQIQRQIEIINRKLDRRER